ncbi:MAG: molybdopterin cofactor-binding domain-containing protein, partial [Pseudomonadota bacterium]
ITADDLEDVGSITPRLHKFSYVAVAQPILPKDRVHYVGQAVAAVVAQNDAAAQDLADQVFLDVEAEDAVTDAAKALAQAQVTVHPEAADNTLVKGKFRTPDFDDALALAPHQIAFDVRSRRQSASPLETRGGVATFDRATGRTTLHASVQMPHMLRTGIADCLGMPEIDLRVVAPDVGGGFGQKMSLFPEYVLLVWLARKYRGCFAWIEDRRENLVASAHSRDQTHRLKAGFDADGHMLALEVDIIANVGAFSCYPVTCGVEPLMALAEYPGPYRLAAYAACARGVTTNTCPMAPYRGVSRPAITFAMERLLDRAARTLRIDPIEIRRRNLVRTFPHCTPIGLELDPGSYIEALDKAAEAVDMPAFCERQQRSRQNGLHLGLGIAVFNERSGYGTPAFAARGMEIVPGYERVEVVLTPSGEVEVRIGASPHGQGLKTAITQVIADELGISTNNVRIVSGDTDRTPYGWGTFASRSMVISGGAAKKGAEKLAEAVRTIAARLLQTPIDEIELAKGTAHARANGAAISLPQLARIAYHQNQQVGDLVGSGVSVQADYDPPGTFSNACHAAIVEVDVETGGVRIERYIVVEDAGRVINPMIVDGQIQGGVAQGIANALFEEIVYDEDGNILTSTLADFLPPTAAEIPEIEIHHLHSFSDASYLEAKGVGEGGVIGAPAAIVNAICDALAEYGVEIDEIPATPERIRQQYLRAIG